MTGAFILRVHIVLLIWVAVAIYRYHNVDGRWGWWYLWPALALECVFFLIFGTGLTYVCK